MSRCHTLVAHTAVGVITLAASKTARVSYSVGRKSGELITLPDTFCQSFLQSVDNKAEYHYPDGGKRCCEPGRYQEQVELAKMALDGRSQLHKCILFVINIVLGLIGFAIMALGMWVRFSAQTRGIFNVDLNTTSFVIVVTLLIVLGLLMMVISAFGNYGACNESKGALTVFVMLLSFLLTFAIAAGTLAIVKSEEVGKLLSDAYTTTYLQYVDKGGDPSMAIMLEFFHNMFDCCGIFGKAVEPIVRETCPKKGFLESFTVPACPKVIASKDYRSPAFMGGFFGMLALMLFALVCSCVIRKGISSSSGPPYILMSSTTFQQEIPHAQPNY
uniref:CD9 antigen-like n=1 Tax=Paramormyrops kingsleyae TaxID=1676925 RepID=A0A3B3RZA4_9TELE